MKKRILSVLLMVTIIATFSMSVYADEAVAFIQAEINKSVTLQVDGLATTPVNVNGEEVPILLYNGSSYLPVRSVAGLAGFDVDWDGDTKTILLDTTKAKLPLTGDKHSILELKLNDRVLLNQYGNRMVSSKDNRTHTLINDPALLTLEDGTVLKSGLMFNNCDTDIDDILEFNDEGLAKFSSTTILLNGEYTKVSGYVKRKYLGRSSRSAQMILIGVDADMTLANVTFGKQEQDTESEFVYFEADVTGMNQIAFTRGQTSNAFDFYDQIIVGGLEFEK